MRSTGFFRVLAGIAVAVLLVGLGVGIYQAGLTAGAAGAAGTGAATGVPYAYGFHGWGWGWGFGFFGILWFLFVIFLLVGLVRFAFGLGPRGGPRGDRHGWGDPTWMDERNRRIADFHRRLHEEGDAGAGPDAAANRGSGGNG